MSRARKAFRGLFEGRGCEVESNIFFNLYAHDPDGDGGELTAVQLVHLLPALVVYPPRPSHLHAGDFSSTDANHAPLVVEIDE